MSEAGLKDAELLLSDDQIDAFVALARRDDWHRHFVGSDIRMILGDLMRARAALSNGLQLNESEH